MVVVEGMGHARRSAARDASSDRRGRRLAVVLHRMWVDGSEFRWRKDSTRTQETAFKEITRSASAEKRPHGDDGWASS
jgi:hypothetical protein